MSELVGDRTNRAGARGIVVEHRGVVEQLDHAAEPGFLADRQLQRRDARAEQLLQLVERPIERRPLTIELVDEDGAGESELLGHPPRDLRLHLDALDRRHHEHREVGHPRARPRRRR